MKRLLFVTMAIAAACGCARQTPLPDVFPETLAGWHRTSLANRPDGREASYEGPGPGQLDARVYALPTPAAALDMANQWQPRADTVFFYRDRFFITVQWKTAERKSLQTFISQLQSRFKSSEP